MCVCARVCVYAHRDGGVLHNCARLALCTRLHVHGSKGRGERKADARGVGGVGQRREIRIRCLFVVRITRRKRGRNWREEGRERVTKGANPIHVPSISD